MLRLTPKAQTDLMSGGVDAGDLDAAAVVAAVADDGDDC